MRVAFLGLGIMGRAMAANLVKAGHEVAVWNRTPGKDVEGARSAASPAEAARGAEVVWMCVSDTKAVESVLFGPQGVHEVADRGHDDRGLQHHLTFRHAPVRRARARARAFNTSTRPMTGSKVGAESGTLIFIVGGEECRHRETQAPVCRDRQEDSSAWARPAKARPPSW